MIALYCPDYLKGINLPGWHIHFLSEDKQMGGHLLDMNLASGMAQVDLTDSFYLLLPQDNEFGKLDLAADLQNKTVKVEGQGK